MNIKPMGNRVLVKINDVSQEKTQNGIILPDTANATSRVKVATVVSVSDGIETIKANDTIYVSDIYDTITHDNVEYGILFVEDILAVIT